MSYVDLFSEPIDELYSRYNDLVSQRDQCFDALSQPAVLTSHKACLARAAVECADEADQIYQVLQIREVGFELK